MSRTRVGVFTGMPMSVLRVVREITTALRAPIRLTCAVATSTSARVTADLGWVPTSKKPLALRRFTRARSRAAWFTSTSRSLRMRLKYPVLTRRTLSSFWISTSSAEDLAPAFAAAVAARVFPKSQRSWEAVTVAVVESDVADVVTLRVNDSGANWPDGLGPDDTVFCSNPFHWPLS